MLRLSLWFDSLDWVTMGSSGLIIICLQNDSSLLVDLLLLIELVFDEERCFRFRRVSFVVVSIDLS